MTSGLKPCQQNAPHSITGPFVLCLHSFIHLIYRLKYDQKNYGLPFKDSKGHSKNPSNLKDELMLTDPSQVMSFSQLLSN